MHIAVKELSQSVTGICSQCAYVSHCVSRVEAKERRQAAAVFCVAGVKMCLVHLGPPLQGLPNAKVTENRREGGMRRPDRHG